MQICRDRKWISGCLGLGDGRKWSDSQWEWSSFWSDKNVLKLIVMMAVKLNVLKTLNCTLMSGLCGMLFKKLKMKV